jgi:uncharacterized protein (DUF2141 family)
LALSVIVNVAATSPSTATLDVSIGGLRSLKGNVLICLTAAPRYFPNCDKDPSAHKLTVTAANANHISFADVAPGNYALALVHDENGNGKLDTRLIIPREGFGFSRNPAIAFGPPSFGSAQFAVGTADSAQSIRMKYML